MHASKKEKLQSKGWNVGNAAEFLGLSTEEEAYIELRLRLSSGLKARRVGARLTQAQLADAIGSSQSRVAKMEAGDPTVSVDLLVRSLLALGASDSDLARIIVGGTRSFRSSGI
jgi:DNA-binding XRE family transcriptional regulator